MVRYANIHCCCGTTSREAMKTKYLWVIPKLLKLLSKVFSEAGIAYVS